MSYETLLFSIEGGVARVTLNRPDKLNSFNVQMHEELQDALKKVASEKTVRVLLLTGAGRGFCAGQDLGDRAVSPTDKPVDLGTSVEKYYAPLVRALRNLPLPIVVAVNGVAAGAGANIALAGDIVIATRSAKFVQPFCKLGLVPDTGGTYFLPRLIGTARAMGLAMTGAALNASDAEAWGLIWKAVDDASFTAEVEALVQNLAQGPTKGFARTKRAIYTSPNHSLDEQLDLERDYMRELGFSRDYAEGVSAFMNKRQPNFTGE
jgi:2-(1,2-epoxy-1,2-dihydrophenyl)acetyl-CoA isomerase